MTDELKKDVMDIIKSVVTSMDYTAPEDYERKLQEKLSLAAENILLIVECHRADQQ